MTFGDAMWRLQVGVRLTKPGWQNNHFIEMGADGRIVDERGRSYTIGAVSDDWRISPVTNREYTRDTHTETKIVYQWRYRKANGKWTVAKNLYTEAEVVEWAGLVVKHAGPFEVPV